MKQNLKIKAVLLRKSGLSYSEILRQVNVAKSTLSAWLRSVGLSKTQEQRLTSKKLASIRRGWLKWQKQRADIANEIRKNACREVGAISNRELWLIGAALYWAEGSKEERGHVGQGVKFSNSDPTMIKIFLKWLRSIIKIKNDDIKCEIYLHESARHRMRKIVRFWSEATKIPRDELKYVYYKRDRTKTKRTNINKEYNGLVRICIKGSSELNRKIAGWIKGIALNS